MTGNGSNTTYKNGDDWGMVQLALALPTLDDCFLVLDYSIEYDICNCTKNVWISFFWDQYWIQSHAFASERLGVPNFVSATCILSWPQALGSQTMKMQQDRHMTQGQHPGNLLWKPHNRRGFMDENRFPLWCSWNLISTDGSLGNFRGKQTHVFPGYLGNLGHFQRFDLCWSCQKGETSSQSAATDGFCLIWRPLCAAMFTIARARRSQGQMPRGESTLRSYVQQNTWFSSCINTRQDS